MSDSAPRHSGSRWEPTSGPYGPRPAGSVSAEAAAEPTLRLPSQTAGRGERDSERRRGLPLLVVGVLTLITLLLTGAWLALSPHLRELQAPASSTSQAPLSGQPGLGQHRRDGDGSTRTGGDRVRWNRDGDQGPGDDHGEARDGEDGSADTDSIGGRG